MDNALYDSPDLERIYNQYQLKVDLLTKIKSHKKKILSANSVMQLDELKNRKRVLRRLGFTSSADVIEMKGRYITYPLAVLISRVACEISSADELLLTEMMFQGAFNDLTPEQCAALLSCFVLSERIEMRQPLKDEALTNPLKIMTSIARRIAKVSQESKMPVIEEEYIASFKSELMDVVYSWAKGSNFQEIWYVIATNRNTDW
jgi:ATP-dependent RNA helicase DOB1